MNKLYFALLLVIFFLLESCYVGRYFYYNLADVNDYKKFPQQQVHHSGKPYRFQKDPNKQLHLSITPKKRDNIGTTISLEEFLVDHKSLAFLIVRNDSIIYEQYFDGYDSSRIIPSFSVAKSFVSALIGIAIDEGKISSLEDPVTDYVEELPKNQGFEQISLRNLLEMRSGIRFSENYMNPFSEIGKLYYGLNVRKYISKLKIEKPPDEEYEYISVNTELLALAIENATNMSLPEYLETKLWSRLGMEFDASWNLDSKNHKTVKAFCCLNARPRDFAKFGRLYLNQGKWEGEQIIPAAWIQKSLCITNDSKDSQNYPYTYHWRSLEGGQYFAKGVLGQFLFLDPNKNLIMLRMGRRYGNVNWTELMMNIADDL